MKIERSILSGISLAKLKSGTSLEVPIKGVPSTYLRGPYKARRGNKWAWLCEGAKGGRLFDMWPHEAGVKPPVRKGQKLYFPAGLVTVEECQTCIDDSFEITYSYADGTWSQPQPSKTPRRAGKQYAYHATRMARLTLRVISVEPIRHGKRHCWHVIYRIENLNEQKS